MKRDLIKELKADKNLYAECPDGHIFPLHRAIMFYVDEPIPPEVQKILKEKQALSERKKDVLNRRKKLKERSEVVGAIGVKSKQYNNLWQWESSMKKLQNLRLLWGTSAGR